MEKKENSERRTNIKILDRWNKKNLTSQNLIEVKNLKKTFQEGMFNEASKNTIMAVDDVSFNIIFRYEKHN